MIKALVLSFVLSICGFSYAGGLRASDTLNKLNRSGEREGWWVLTKENDPVNGNNGNQMKLKEGRYINGRKNGVWITYYEDGKTPRLIGEYSDNRPSGSYFRFDRKGDLQQASAIPKSISVKQRVQVSNPVFSCRMFFNQRDVVAGQVFFYEPYFQEGPGGEVLGRVFDEVR